MKDWVGWFRHTSPYINSHRHQIQVLALSGDVLAHQNFDNIIHDIALLNSLGVKLVVVFGARPQIDQRLSQASCTTAFENGLRVTTAEVLPKIVEAYGRLRTEFEAKLSMGVINSPMHGSQINVVSGNVVWAKPIGVLNGIDFSYTGQVRKIDVQAINKHLENNSVVLIPSLGYSVSGDIFNLSYEDLAGEVAAALSAQKLIFFNPQNGLLDHNDALIHELTVQQAQEFTPKSEDHQAQETVRQLRASAKACHAGVSRAHILSYTHDGALLEELFTRDGSGTMISIDPFDQIRPARLEDINGILELIQPLEEDGYLVRRSRELIENELDYFIVDVRDNTIIGCAALYPFPNDDAGELSCFAVNQSYRREGRGDSLLSVILERARQQNFKKLFVLTTKTEHWFIERGFESSSQQDLPGNKAYNNERNAKVLVKPLNETK